MTAPLPGIVNSARALSYYSRLQEVTANNLANANTDGFKVDRLTAERLPGSRFPVPVEQTDFRQGTFKETERPLDVALDGPGFFMVRTPAGDRLTRGGSLHLDPVGRLTDQNGDPMIGTDGEPLVLSGTDVKIQGDGTVLVDGAEAGQLRTVTVADLSTLKKEGFGRYQADTPLIEVPEGETQVRQGAVEEPNVDSVLSMVDLITIQRAYSANVDALKAMDSVLGTITNEVGKVP